MYYMYACVNVLCVCVCQRGAATAVPVWPMSAARTYDDMVTAALPVTNPLALVRTLVRRG